jgi:surface protein
MASMFRDCNNLTTLDLSNFDTSNVTDMSEMFANGTSLTTLDLSSFATSNVTNTRSMFTGCWDNLKVTYNPTTWTIGTTNWPKVTFVAK